LKKSKKERGEEKFKKAILAGARITEKSLSKIGWDIAHDKIKISLEIKWDYQIYWALQCVANLIAKEKYFGQIFNTPTEIRFAKFHEEPHRYFVVVEYKTFINFLGRKDISTEKATEIFLKLPDIILTAKDGKTKIPFCLANNNWTDINLYKDNICGVAVATKTYHTEHRSERKMKGKGVGKEEPVFILIFSNDYGKAFVENAMNRKGAQLQDHRLFRLDPKAQELFQAIRWRESQRIILNTEQISKTCGFVWPTSNIRERVSRIRKILGILKDNGFINYDQKSCEKGKEMGRKAWIFYIAKRKIERLTDQVSN